MYSGVSLPVLGFVEKNIIDVAVGLVCLADALRHPTVGLDCEQVGKMRSNEQCVCILAA